LPQDFEIDSDQLEKNYIKLQQIFHPDKQINKTKLERLISLEHAAKINKAYNVLKDNKKRAEYLLYLEGIIINQEEGNNLSPDPAILVEILEIREAAQDFNIKNMQEECWEIFKKKFKEKAFQAAAQSIIKLQFLNKFLL